MSNVFVGRGLSFGAINDGRRIITIPSGLIVPYNDTTAPDGWALYTSADGKYIIGAGSTYSVNDTAAASSTPTYTSDSTVGAHLGSPTFNSGFGGASGTTGGVGGHTDTHVPGGTLDPGHEQLRLIKASSDLSFLPSGAQMMTHNSTYSLLSESYGNSRYLRAGATIASNAKVDGAAGNTVGAGAHNHGSSRGSPSGDGSGAYNTVAAGNHTHSMTMTLTYKLQGYQLSAWSNASKKFALQPNMIGMYESVTPPTGWNLCNGTSGTPDLRDYFVQITPNASHGSTNGYSGFNLNGSGTSGSGGSHTHQGGFNPGAGSSSTTYHGTFANAHTHTFDEDKSWMPAYYALAFIMKA